MTQLLAAPPCPCCGGTHIEPFFKIVGAPIFSLVTMKSRAEAMAVPRKDIELAFCHGCGFIFNRLYDTSIDYFTLGYEDQQGFSKTFMAYLTRISEDLIQRHGLQGKTLMEIGCGKGDFIRLLCELAQARGIGVDPAYEEGRQNHPGLTFYREFYARHHGQLAPDFICCRHTLEHIFDTRGFMQGIRDSLPEGSHPAVFFEVPEISRILDVPAFWDIYYEHCSYFSAGSMARLFRRTGFEVTAARLDYSDQYLLIEAVPSDDPSEVVLPLEESVADQQARIARFKIRISEQLGEWRERLTRMKREGKKVVVWGGGSKSVGFLTNFADLEMIEHVVDINPHMENNFIPGIGSQYVQPQFLAELQPDVVIIMNGVYEKEITATLREMHVHAEVFAL
jgi:SAM-dependent methyltransferase